MLWQAQIRVPLSVHSFVCLQWNMIYLMAFVHSCVPRSVRRPTSFSLFSLSTCLFISQLCAVLKNAEPSLRFRGMTNSLLSAATARICFGLFLETCDLAPKKDLQYSRDSWNKWFPVFLNLVFQLRFPVRMKYGFVVTLGLPWTCVWGCHLAWEMCVYLTQLGASTFAWWLFWQLSNSLRRQSKHPSTSESNPTCAIQS